MKKDKTMEDFEGEIVSFDSVKKKWLIKYFDEANALKSNVEYLGVQDLVPSLRDAVLTV